MPVCLSTRKEEREAKAEILHVAEEFLARFEQPGLQQEASADAPPLPAPIKLYAPAVTQDEMSPAQGGTPIRRHLYQRPLHRRQQRTASLLLQNLLKTGLFIKPGEAYLRLP